MQLVCADRRLDLACPQVMGVLNVTPDSFSDGGRFLDPAVALVRAEQMVAEGAALIDVGGESTRPGAAPVSTEEELRRVLPVVERIAGRLDVIVSVDTSNPEIMRRSTAAGAHFINDVRALSRPGALEAVAASGAGVCLMHMQGTPETMQLDPHYQDVVAQVHDFLAARLAACETAGIRRERLCADPGFGFGKRLPHNLALLRRLPELQALGVPLLVGLSRKSLLRELTGRETGQRLGGGVALASVAVMRGARIVRAHDVAATVDALRVVGAVLACAGE